MHKAAFTPENAAMLLIDYQLGTMGWKHSHDINLVEPNALKLAKTAEALGLRRSTFRDTAPPRQSLEALSINV
jgi:nicotinamidase-related amidase